MNQASQSQSLHTYAEPLSGLRVSWGAILAGALAMMGVSLIVWALALAIVLTASGSTVNAFRTDAVALGVCAIVTTLIGAAVGGLLSGFLPGNPRRAIGGVHGFLAWATAFIVVSAFGGSTLLTSALAAARAEPQVSAMVAPGAAVGTLAEERAIDALETLGYTRTQAETLLRSGGAARPAPRTDGVSNAAVGLSAGLAWAWFGTWLVAGAIATAAGMVATRRSRSFDITDDFVAPRPRRYDAEPTAAMP
jgi:hypothetical protein